jgi:hypothetical protein
MLVAYPQTHDAVSGSMVYFLRAWDTAPRNPASSSTTRIVLLVSWASALKFAGALDGHRASKLPHDSHHHGQSQPVPLADFRRKEEVEDLGLRLVIKVITPSRSPIASEALLMPASTSRS